MDLVMLKPCRNILEANHLCQLLQDEGIDAVTMGGPLEAARGELPLTMETLPSVWVRHEDVERATAALEQVAEQARQARLEEDALDEETPEKQPPSARSTLLWVAVCLGSAGWLIWRIVLEIRGFIWLEADVDDWAGLIVTALLMGGIAAILLRVAYGLARRYLQSRNQTMPPGDAPEA